MLRGIFDRLWWLIIDITKVALTIASGYIAYVLFIPPNTINLSYFVDIHTISLVIRAIGTALFILGALKLFVLLRTKLVLEKIPPLSDSDVDPISGDKINSFKEQSIIYSPPLNMAIEYGNNPIYLEKKLFEIHPIIKKMLPLFVMRMPDSKLDTFDSKKVRLCSDLFKEFIEESQCVQLQITSYFRDRLSNSLANYRISLDGRTFLELRGEVIENRKLIPLRTSHMSNQLGGSVILITKNGTILYLKQGNRTAENAGRPSPAGSGSFDIMKKSYMESISFQDYVKLQTKRELKEECGLTDADIIDIQICGFGRYLYRNGKPEIFCIASTSRDSNRIAPPLKEWDYQQKTPMFETIHGVVNKINTIAALEALEQKMNRRDNQLVNACGPLYWNVIFAKEYLSNISSAKESKLFPWVVNKNT